MHYVYAWLAHYFHTHFTAPNALHVPMMVKYSGEGGSRYFNEEDARDLIHNNKETIWWATSLVTKENKLFVDHGKLSDVELGYFISVRSNYLVLHREGEFLVEPYSPYRFSRQFGFYQGIPKELESDVRSTTYELCRMLWLTLARHRTGSKILFPSTPISANRHVFPDFLEWWSKVHGKYLLEGRASLISSAQPNPEHKRSKTQELVKPMVCSKGRDTPKGSEKSKGDMVALEGTGTAPDPTPEVQEIGNYDVFSSSAKEKNASFDDDDVPVDSDQNWKRKGHKKSKVMTLSLDEYDLDPSEFFQGVASVSMSGISSPEILNDPILLCLDDEEESQGEVEGPTAFELLAKQVSNSTQGDAEADTALEPPSVQKPPLVIPMLPERVTPQENALRREKLKVFDPACWRAPSQVSQVSEFCTDAVISSCRKGYIQMLWNNLQDKLLRVPLERVSSLEPKVNEIMKEMGSSNAMDLSSLQRLLKTFFANAVEYESANTALSQKIPLASYDELLASTKKRLEDAIALDLEESGKVSTCKAKLEELSAEEVKIKMEMDCLKKRLGELDVEKKEMLHSLQSHQAEMGRVSAEVTKLRVEVVTLENSTPLLEEESETLQKMKELLEANRQELSDFKL